jgi:enoyl-CoA hydratase
MRSARSGGPGARLWSSDLCELPTIAPVTENLHTRLEGAVAIVEIDRPAAMNALDHGTLTGLRDRLAELSADDSVRAVVLTGSGEKAFAAGADIAYMAGLDAGGARDWAQLGHDTATLLETMPKVTIAAVNGVALGGGCELALACDLRYAASTARLGQPEVNLGILPGWGGTQRLARATSLGFAKDLILTGRLVGAQEALDRGLIDGIADPVLDRALETAQAIALKSLAAIAAAKRLVNGALQGDHDANLDAEIDAFGALFTGADSKEGLAAFVEKRTPRFSGAQ